MKIELENVDSLKDFKKQYYSLVDNTPHKM